MTFLDWLFSDYPNPRINGQWGWLHITVLVGCIALIVALSLIFRKKSRRAKRIVLCVLVAIIMAFEITRRTVYLCHRSDYSWQHTLYTLLPRPWCAISCWMLFVSAIVNKDWFYNYASLSALLCSVLFFSYPGAGFNNQYILFENLYSIATHSLLLVTSILLLTFRLTNFEYRTIWKSAILYVATIVYAIIEIYALKIEPDPLYFLPNNDVMNILHIPYAAYLSLYIIFSLIYFNVPYLIQERKKIFRKRHFKVRKLSE